MGQVLHACATSTHVVRASIQRSQSSVTEIAQQYGIDQKIVRKRRQRQTVEDARMGSKVARSTVLRPEDEAACVAFRQHTLLPLDDCLYALQAPLPHLTRSALHRLFQRHGISRLPDLKAATEPKRAFKSYPIGYFHIDIAEARSEEGKLYLFVAMDRTSKFAFVRLEDRADTKTAVAFLNALVEAAPHRIHTILTDNGIQFADLPRNRPKPTALWRGHPFDRACGQHDIEHRLTKPNHPWTKGQVERVNRTLKEATVRRYHYETHDRLKERLDAFVNA